MPLRRVTEAAYERHRQKLAESAPARPAAPSVSGPAAAPPSAKSAAVSTPAAPSAAPLAAAASHSGSAAATAAQQQPPPTANPVAPTPSLFHFECLRCGFSSKQSSKTVCASRTPPYNFFGASEFQLTQVCRRCRWVPPQGSQIRHDAADASQVNKLAGMSALSSCALCFVPRRSVHGSVSDHCSSQRGVRVS